jgi:glucokinase
MSTAPAPLAVVADIGGTNTRVALARGTGIEAQSIRRYRNAEAEGIEAILRHYLAEQGAAPQAACVAMAGPVLDGRGTLTNLDWLVDRTLIAEATGAETVAVLNDLQAQGHALAHIGGSSLMPLMPGEPASPQAARLVVGFGTGLNAAAVYRLGNQTLVPPAEAGHITIPVQDEDELRLMRDVARYHGTPGIEDVLSGRGFERIYRWMSQEAGNKVDLPAAEIMQALGSDPLADKAVALFVRLMGRYAGNLALVTLPFGGVYLCGGVAQHFAPHLMANGFAEAFCDKGRFAPFMERFPVHLITDDYAALTGCAGHLVEITG